MQTLYVIKTGGAVLEDEQQLSEFLNQFKAVPHPKVLVHGGGRLATKLATQLGIEVKMHEGRRITCKDTLQITVMAYAGWINKNIVARLNAAGEKALGVCGADLSLIPAAKRVHTDIDFGFVGDVLADQIPAGKFIQLFEQGITPVIAPLTADKKGQLLNTNADTIASALAGTLAKHYKVNLLFGFEKEGVLHCEKVISHICEADYKRLRSEKVITDGMIPKLDNAFGAVRLGVNRVVIGKASRLQNLISEHEGTHISA